MPPGASRASRPDEAVRRDHRRRQPLAADTRQASSSHFSGRPDAARRPPSDSSPASRSRPPGDSCSTALTWPGSRPTSATSTRSSRAMHCSRSWTSPATSPSVSSTSPSTSRETKKRVGEMLELVQLAGYEKRRVNQLSGGQQQRVALARALVLKPAVLLLDEPLGALDAKLRRTLQVELKAIQERVGITFFYVTHDQEEALTMSDRLAVMTGGRIAQARTHREPSTRSPPTPMWRTSSASRT